MAELGRGQITGYVPDKTIGYQDYQKMKDLGLHAIEAALGQLCQVWGTRDREWSPGAKSLRSQAKNL